MNKGDPTKRIKKRVVKAKGEAEKIEIYRKETPKLTETEAEKKIKYFMEQNTKLTRTDAEELLLFSEDDAEMILFYMASPRQMSFEGAVKTVKFFKKKDPIETKIWLKLIKKDIARKTAAMEERQRGIMDQKGWIDKNRMRYAEEAREEERRREQAREAENMDSDHDEAARKEAEAEDTWREGTWWG